jgi:hypothetical protein
LHGNEFALRGLQRQSLYKVVKQDCSISRRTKTHKQNKRKSRLKFTREFEAALMLSASDPE